MHLLLILQIISAANFESSSVSAPAILPFERRPALEIGVLGSNGLQSLNRGLAGVVGGLAGVGSHVTYSSN